MLMMMEDVIQCKSLHDKHDKRPAAAATRPRQPVCQEVYL